MKNDEEDEDEDDEEDEEGREQGVIRGKAGRLKGTKVVGKVKVDDSKPKRRKKRKRKKDRKQDEEDGENTKSSKREKKKSKKKRRKSRGKRVDDDDVEEKMKETLQKMQSSETVGSRRQKYRKQRREDREEEQQKQSELDELEEGIIEATEFITVSDLADLLHVKANDVITTCMDLGMMVSINQRLDASTIELVAEEYGYEVEFVDADEAIEEIELEEDDPEDLEPPSPHYYCNGAR
ncbi:MAG: translation initiation factor IF-2 N-terminal domain-containing protein [Fodinibius sp.]|nr:translation initiation factor IF-2 N-terminal domain-containing protein [Fodinibius sp.]